MVEINQLVEVQRVVAGLLDQARDWDAATPCPEWDARRLVEHVIGGDRGIATAVGSPPSAPESADLATAYRASSAALAEALTRPEVLDAEVEVPAGKLPGRQLLALRTVEHTVHGWDFARSQGLPTDELSAGARPLVQVTEIMLAQLGGAAVGRLPFAERQPVPADAPPIDQLVALLGRDPNWVA